MIQNSFLSTLEECFEFCYWNLPDTQNVGVVVNLRQNFGFIKPTQTDAQNLYFSKLNLHNSSQTHSPCEICLS